MEHTRLRVNVLVGKQGRGQVLLIRHQSRNVALDEPMSVSNAVPLCAQLVMLHLQRMQLMAENVTREHKSGDFAERTLLAFDRSSPDSRNQ